MASSRTDCFLSGVGVRLCRVKAVIFQVIIGAIVVASLLNAGWTVVKAMGAGELQDFRVYHQAAQDLSQHLNPYHAASYAFIYPPSALSLLWPVSWLPVQWAEMVWTALSLFALALSLKLVANDLKPKPHWLWWVSGVVLSFWLFPVKFTFGMGQINLLVLVLIVVAWRQQIHQKSVWAGVWLGLAAALKLFPLLLLIPWMMERRWKSVLVAGVVFVLLHLPAVLLFSPSVLLDFYLTQLNGIPRIGNAVYYNQAFTGVMARLELPNQLSNWINTGLGIGFITTMLCLRRAESSPELSWLEFGLWMCGWLLVGGLAWQHHFVWVIPALLVLTQQYWRDKRWGSQVCLALVAALMGYNFKTPPTELTLWWLLGSHATWGNLGLMTLLIRERSRSLPSRD